MFRFSVMKTVYVFLSDFTPAGEDEGVIYKVKFKGQESFKEFLRNTSAAGLVRVPDEEEEEDMVTVLMDIKDLEDGQLYCICDLWHWTSFASMRRKWTHMKERREGKASQAALRNVQREDQMCIPDPSLRVLEDSKGRDETELDGGIICKSQQAIGLSHKTDYTGGSMVEDIAKRAPETTQGSSEAAHAGTHDAQFNGKKVVPAFMAKCTAAAAEASVRRAARQHGVKLYRRNGSSIAPSWAPMTPLRQAAARPALMRWVV